MKKVLVIIALCLIGGYLIFAAFYFQGKPKELVCKDFEVEVEGGEEDSFIKAGDIRRYITDKGLNPQGKKLKDIDTYKIEEAILANQSVKVAKVFETNGGNVRVVLQERKPILRIMSNTGENYYIDRDGFRMPISKYQTAHLPIATGTIKEDFAKSDLYKFALFLYDNDFWNAQIDQIDVRANHELILIPRVGDHQIVLGKVDGFEEKLEKLMAFYKNGLNKTGWNTYSVINLKYDKQVVCTKR